MSDIEIINNNKEFVRNFIASTLNYENETKLKVTGVISKTLKKVSFDSYEQLGLIR